MLNLEQIILSVPAILLAIAFHELGHAYAAYKLGDPTPKYQGRLTLNPFAHLDPLGTIMLLLFRIGWARPVVINPQYFKNRKRDTVLVSLAGPLANVLLGWLFYNLLRLATGYVPIGSFARSLFLFFLLNVQINLSLAAFNLLPIPPLDGSNIVAGILPPKLEYEFSRLAPYGPIILIILLISGGARLIINPIYGLLSQLIIRLSF
ncbi:MAG TPA: site-2 protease family protein [Firmicutes bacterium]|nr:site-2 protease family protein [Bacillota bacterium]